MIFLNAAVALVAVLIFVATIRLGKK